MQKAVHDARHVPCHSVNINKQTLREPDPSDFFFLQSMQRMIKQKCHDLNPLDSSFPRTFAHDHQDAFAVAMLRSLRVAQLRLKESEGGLTL